MAPILAVLIPIVSTVASVGGTIYSAVSSSQAAAEARRRSHREAYRADRAAAQAREIAAQKAGDFQRRARAALSSERAFRGASGVSMQGTPLLTYYENAQNYARDVGRIQKGGEIEATGWLEKAYESRKAGDAAYRGGVGQSLLTGATSIYETGKEAGWWGGKGVV